MFERLSQLVEEMEIPPDGDALTEVFAVIDRLTAKASLALGEFDAAGLWELDAATSATAWLRTRAGMTGSTAKATVKTAQRLRSLPVTSAAWLDGSLTGGQVAAVVANVNSRCAALFAEHEADVVPTLTTLSTAETAVAMQLWRTRAEALLDEQEPSVPEASLHLSRTLDGCHELSGSFDVESGEIVAAALRLADDGDFERMPAVRRADALVDVCRFFLDHQDRVPGGRHRPHLNVVVDYEGLVEGRGGRVVGGGYLDAASIKRLLCDCALHRVVTDGRSSILDYGTATRTVPANLWNALVLRDEHCRHVGCDRPAHFCEAHHVVPWIEGGATSLDNLVLKCRKHHGVGHKPGWSEKLKPDGSLVVTDPGGRTHTTHPPGLTRDVMRGCMPSHARGEGGTRRRSATGGVQRGKRQDRRHPAPALQFE